MNVLRETRQMGRRVRSILVSSHSLGLKYLRIFKYLIYKYSGVLPQPWVSNVKFLWSSGTISLARSQAPTSRSTFF